MKNKKFIVVSSFDNFERSSDNVYKYNGCCNNENLNKIFDTLEDAISFADDYNLDVSKNRFSLYVENISVYEYDETIDDMLENSNSLYDKCFTDEDIENKFDIKIKRF